ncbi:hypothetical protein [Actinomadura sp. WMMB 499]|uniref:hypothetical protein n=1 Tax=Actinomadura sp. WMMB 499 TaxID=1219491 RepID=UPI0012473AF1|nr:hypothetical protein [Actinomadura sp. WMMB 499]QFG25450.1 hypothetical protein F7P10_34100 [Actinomadura sp. WMMB 499]
MAILDKANEVVRAYPIRMADDGYGGTYPTFEDEAGNPLPYVEFRAFILPVGFAGAGWAIDSRITAQGWADVNRCRLIFKPLGGSVPTDKWGRLEFRGQLWTVQEDPRIFQGLRPSQSYVSLTAELMGDA